MMEFLRFTFESGQHFAGVVVLAIIAAYAVSSWFQIHHHTEDDES